MTIEFARTHAVPKPWGVGDLRPWRADGHDGGAVGEIWYERSGSLATEPALLLKLLFTNQPLSIQVHPDDAQARSFGLPNGKTEAWYVLSAAPGARIALGLSQASSPQQLRQAVSDGSIAGLVAWREVAVNDVVSVPAGTIHAIGAGLVIAEIQQRSDATFRLFDHGRTRELHVDRAVAVASPGPADVRTPPIRLSSERTLLVANRHFTFERIELAPGTTWRLVAEHETWLLILRGGGRAGALDVVTGDAVFAEYDRIDLGVGDAGMTALVAYAGAGGAEPALLARLAQAATPAAVRTHAAQKPPVGCQPRSIAATTGAGVGP